jgi:hypothetical protein
MVNMGTSGHKQGERGLCKREPLDEDWSLVGLLTKPA